MSDSPIIAAFALPQESRDFRDALARRPGAGIRVEHFGVGPAVAAARVERWLAGEKPRLLICAGFAGGLDPKLKLGDVVVAQNLTSPDALARIGSPPPCFVGPIVSRPTPIESVADKANLFHETGALAVDMESEAVAAVCRANGVPLLVVRVISDPAGTPLPVPFATWFDLARQRPRVGGLLRYLITHPARLAPFAGFVRGLAPARRALTAFLVDLIAAGQLGKGG